MSSSVKTTTPTPPHVETQSYVTPVPQRETPPLLHFNTEPNVTPAVYEPEDQENRDLDVTPIQQESEDTINRDIEDSTSSSSKEMNTDKDYTMDYLLDKFFNITKSYEDQYFG